MPVSERFVLVKKRFPIYKNTPAINEINLRIQECEDLMQVESSIERRKALCQEVAKLELLKEKLSLGTQ